MLARELTIPNHASFFLFGPRQTGKSYLIEHSFNQAEVFRINLLSTREYVRYLANPSILFDEVKALPRTTSHVFIDEVQKVPALLDEVQSLIDSKVPQRFILTGSSARKLRRSQANLLGGRAWSLRLYPLSMHELGDSFDLQAALTYGTLPSLALDIQDGDRLETLRSYADTYIEQEIKAEAITRNLSGFVRFLAVAAQCNGEQVNYSSLARDVHLGRETVREYFSVLEDTLIGNFLLPFHHSQRKRHKLSPKFYFFDTGALRAMQQRLSLAIQPGTLEYGNYFETFVINEVFKINAYLKKDWKIGFLRTENDVEVDLTIETPRGQVLGIEIKSKPAPSRLDFNSGCQALKAICPKAKFYCVCSGEHKRIVENTEVLPLKDLMTMLREL
jgi:uncharacterized protein